MSPREVHKERISLVAALATRNRSTRTNFPPPERGRGHPGVDVGTRDRAVPYRCPSGIGRAFWLEYRRQWQGNIRMTLGAWQFCVVEVLLGTLLVHALAAPTRESCMCCCP